MKFMVVLLMVIGVAMSMPFNKMKSDPIVSYTKESILKAASAMIDSGIEMTRAFDNVMNYVPEGPSLKVFVPRISLHLRGTKSFPGVYVKTPPFTFHVPETDSGTSAATAEQYKKDVLERIDKVIVSVAKFRMIRRLIMPGDDNDSGLVQVTVEPYVVTSDETETRSEFKMFMPEQKFLFPL